MSQEMREVSFSECEEIKCVKTEVKVEGNGNLLKVPILLTDVCSCRELIVGVQVFVKGKFYAMKTKKVFTGGCPKSRKICTFFAGDFYFLFTNTCNHDITINVISHYIC